MTITWSEAARGDLRRIYEFLAPRDRLLADTVLDRLIASPERLSTFPRRGSPVTVGSGVELRQYREGNYLIRYRTIGGRVDIVRIFHVAERR